MSPEQLTDAAWTPKARALGGACLRQRDPTRCEGIAN